MIIVFVIGMQFIRASWSCLVIEEPMYNLSPNPPAALLRPLARCYRLEDLHHAPPEQCDIVFDHALACLEHVGAHLAYQREVAVRRAVG